MIQREDFKQIGRGCLMGGADVVPGVSGGTVALILGIYDRLVRAISRCDGTLFGHVRRREWKAAAEYLDLRFLITLGLGIATGILGLASLMHYLLEDQEHITVHSVDREAQVVRLNVGTDSGGVPVGTVCPVYRKDANSDGFQIVAELRIDSYEDDETEDTMRTAIAKPVGDAKAAMVHVDDFVMQPSERRPLTLAAFFGLILASTVLVGRMMERWTVGSVLAAIAGGAFSFWLVGAVPIAPYEGNSYLFFCGLLAICAMILPGISGAFILLILGVYSDVTGLLRTLLQRQATPDTILKIVVFVAGCGIGLLSFSKLLNWLLGRYRLPTMAVLCGFMAGSLRKIWPFKVDLSPDQTRFRSKLFGNVWPASWDSQTFLIFGVMIIAAAAVFLLDRLTAGHEHQPHADEMV